MESLIGDGTRVIAAYGSGEASAANVKQHGVYYMISVIFQVEDTLFRVPKTLFTKPDTVFSSMFTLPTSSTPRETVEGSDDSRPIKLGGISAQYFFNLLLVMYPFERTANEYEEWLGALDLATMWTMNEIRAKAIHALTPLLETRDPVENVILAKRYSVKTWLEKNYTDLIKDSDLILEDLRKPQAALDWETISRIFATQTLAGRTVSQGIYERPNYSALVDANFSQELKDMTNPEDISWQCACAVCSRASDTTSSTGQDTEGITVKSDFEVEAKPATSESVQPGNTIPRIPKRCSVYYLATKIFLVEDTLFCIPVAGLLSEGAIFRDEYKHLEARDDDPSPGSAGLSDEYPIRLLNTTARHFEGFVKALYPLSCYQSFTYDDWLGAFDLSTRWRFTKIRQIAIEALSPILKGRNPVESILLGRHYNVRQWFLDGYLSLVERVSMGYAELRVAPFELDWESIAKLLHIRSKVWSDPYVNTNWEKRSPFALCKGCQGGDKRPCRYRCSSLRIHGPSQRLDSMTNLRDDWGGNRQAQMLSFVEMEFTIDLARME